MMTLQGRKRSTPFKVASRERLAAGAWSDGVLAAMFLVWNETGGTDPLYDEEMALCARDDINDAIRLQGGRHAAAFGRMIREVQHAFVGAPASHAWILKADRAAVAALLLGEVGH